MFEKPDSVLKLRMRIEDWFCFALFLSRFSPYLSADLRLMASCFNTTLVALEEELMTLILDEQIQARIDSHNKVSKTDTVDPQSRVF